MAIVIAKQNPTSFEQSARTAVAATAALLIARLFHQQEAYWAPITTVIILQSTLGATLNVSAQRFVGTALGAAAGALVATYFLANLWAFGAAVFALGLICTKLRLDRSAYRYAGVTLAVITLVVRTNPAWIVAIHCFAEVSIGIVVGLGLTALWPEHQIAAYPVQK